VYAWIWRKFPGNTYAKLTQSLVLATAVVALLWYVVFPWATPLLPFDDVQVSNGTQSGPAQPDPNAVVPGDDPIPYDQQSNNPEPTPSR
jgi:membrane-bound metal-dependent hydrolase YbcI (DUF457 family)